MRAVIFVTVIVFAMAVCNNEIVSLALLSLMGCAGLIGLCNARVKGG